MSLLYIKADILKKILLSCVYLLKVQNSRCRLLNYCSTSRSWFASPDYRIRPSTPMLEGQWLNDVALSSQHAPASRVVWGCRMLLGSTGGFIKYPGFGQGDWDCNYQMQPSVISTHHGGRAHGFVSTLPSLVRTPQFCLTVYMPLHVHRTFRLSHLKSYYLKNRLE